MARYNLSDNDTEGSESRPDKSATTISTARSDGWNCYYSQCSIGDRRLSWEPGTGGQKKNVRPRNWRIGFQASRPLGVRRVQTAACCTNGNPPCHYCPPFPPASPDPRRKEGAAVVAQSISPVCGQKNMEEFGEKKRSLGLHCSDSSVSWQRTPQTRGRGGNKRSWTSRRPRYLPQTSSPLAGPALLRPFRVTVAVWNHGVGICNSARSWGVY